METYFIIDKFGYLKIGRSLNSNIRIGQLKTANPHIMCSWYINGNYEKILHKYFEYYRYKGEWFNLRKEYIISKSLMSYKNWLIHEVMLTINAYNRNKINDLDNIRLNRYIIK